MFSNIRLRALYLLLEDKREDVRLLKNDLKIWKNCKKGDFICCYDENHQIDEIIAIYNNEKSNNHFSFSDKNVMWEEEIREEQINCIKKDIQTLEEEITVISHKIEINESFLEWKQCIKTRIYITEEEIKEEINKMWE